MTQLSSGAPLAGTKVSVFTPAGKQVWSDTTNDDGIVKIPGSALLKQQKPVGEEPEAQLDWDNYRSQRLIEGDLA